MNDSAVHVIRTDTLGLVIPDITNPFFPALVQAIEHAAGERGLGILIVDAANDPEAERVALRRLVDRRVDAVLISPTHLTESRAALTDTANAVPTIQIDRVIDSSLPWIRANQSRPVELIVKHLRGSGRRHLAFIGQRTTVSTSLEREEAFARLMSESTSESPAEPLRIVKEGVSAESGRTAARELMSSWPDTDAIICANDLIAVGVVQELGPQPGRREVAISGFDDTLLARTLRITSVRQPVQQMADAALAAATDPAGVPADLAIELTSDVTFRLSTA